MLVRELAAADAPASTDSVVGALGCAAVVPDDCELLPHAATSSEQIRAVSNRRLTPAPGPAGLVEIRDVVCIPSISKMRLGRAEHTNGAGHHTFDELVTYELKGPLAAWRYDVNLT